MCAKALKIVYHCRQMCFKIQNGVWVELLFGRMYIPCFSGRGGIPGIVSLKRWSGAESPEGLGAE